MNTSPPITLAERLAKVPNGELSVRLAKARVCVMYSQTSYQREAAMREIDDLKRAMFERGLGVAE